jgi:phage terminase large subunit-like protein
MSLLLPAPTVVQPRFLTLPPSVSSARDEVVALASSAGLELDPWQQDCVGWILAEKADGNWAAREAGLFCNRQNGKNVVLEAIELAGLFLFDEDLILHTAHEFKTALEAYIRIKGLIESTPDLHRLVRQYYSSSAAVGIELHEVVRPWLLT